jgi:hypothetical protein
MPIAAADDPISPGGQSPVRLSTGPRARAGSVAGAQPWKFSGAALGGHPAMTFEPA